MITNNERKNMFPCDCCCGTTSKFKTLNKIRKQDFQEPFLYDVAKAVAKVFNAPHYRFEINGSKTQFSIVRIWYGKDTSKNIAKEYLEEVRCLNDKMINDYIEDEYKEIMTAFMEDKKLHVEVLGVGIKKFDLDSLDDVAKFCHEYKKTEFYKEDSLKTAPYILERIRKIREQKNKEKA